MRKIVAFFIVSTIFVLSINGVFADSSKTYEVKRKEKLEKIDKSKGAFIVVNKIQNMLRSQWSHYGIEYQVPPYWYLNGSWRNFEGYNICLKTDPVAHGGGYIYIELIKDGFWSNPSQGTKKIKLNNGFQTVRWHGVGAGSYRLHIGNPDNNLRVSDLEAEIYDC